MAKGHRGGHPVRHQHANHSLSRKASDKLFSKGLTHGFNSSEGPDRIRANKNLNPNASPMRGGIRL